MVHPCQGNKELLHQLSGYHSHACQAVRYCLHGKDIVKDITDQEPNRKLLSTKEMHRRQPLTMVVLAMVVLAIPQVMQPPRALPMKHPSRM